jgi:hypothetical protein
MAKPITHELQHVWITADGKRFLNEDDAKKHQIQIEEREKEGIREEIKELKRRLNEYEDSQSCTSDAEIEWV